MRLMKKYSDHTFQNPPNFNYAWTKYKIIVPTEEDRQELMEAFKHIHDEADIDSDCIVVNQLIHEYRDKQVDENAFNNIIVDSSIYDLVKDREGNS